MQVLETGKAATVPQMVILKCLAIGTAATWPLSRDAGHFLKREENEMENETPNEMENENKRQLGKGNPLVDFFLTSRGRERQKEKKTDR